MNKIALNTILPDLAPEEQFKFSLDLALKRKYDEAELITRKALKINPNLEIIHSNLGNILRIQGKLEEAELFTRKAIK